jgi:2-C-methyl-D-erythritol 2,4-cyclodiphosphate synthase
LSNPDEIAFQTSRLSERDTVRSVTGHEMRGEGGTVRVGIGYDIHPLASGRPLVLGGVPIAHDRGLTGHSDADALVHALCDAILGALNLGDLGQHFPEEETPKDISSLVILGRVVEMMTAAGYRVMNVDGIIHAEKPQMAPFRDAMAANIANVLDVDRGCVSIKATRGEGLGPVGECRAIAATVVVLLEKRTGNRTPSGGGIDTVNGAG